MCNYCIMHFLLHRRIHICLKHDVVDVELVLSHKLNSITFTFLMFENPSSSSKVIIFYNLGYLSIFRFFKLFRFEEKKWKNSTPKAQIALIMTNYHKLAK